MDVLNKDRFQKTWIPEGTIEYDQFKCITGENEWLGKFLRSHLHLRPGNLVLDVGGRKGDIALAVQSAEFIHIVDPDPTLRHSVQFGRFIKQCIQDVRLSDQYSLIICSHVLGYLGLQQSQDQVFQTLMKSVAPGGTLALFYNTNTGYMNELLEFSKKPTIRGHYDYFNEVLMGTLDPKEFRISSEDKTFQLNYPSFDALARCCWFLFGAMDQDIPRVAAHFLPKLRKDLSAPAFSIEERVTLIQRIP